MSVVIFKKILKISFVIPFTTWTLIKQFSKILTFVPVDNTIKNGYKLYFSIVLSAFRSRKKIKVCASIIHKKNGTEMKRDEHWRLGGLFSENCFVSKILLLINSIFFTLKISRFFIWTKSKKKFDYETWWDLSVLFLNSLSWKISEIWK